MEPIGRVRIVREAVAIFSLFISALMGSSCCAEAQEAEAKFKKYIFSDYHQGLVGKALASLPPLVFRRCPTLVSKQSQTTIIKPISIGPNGLPNGGTWKQTFPISGCGNDTILNFFFFATADEKIRTIVGIPGTTHADPLLQRDSMLYAMIAAKAEKSCKEIHVINTEFLHEVGQPLEGARGMPWDELWTLYTCGKKAQVRMHFIPDKTGTTITTSQGETKFLPN